MGKIDANDKRIKGIFFEVGGDMKVDDGEILTDRNATVGINVRGNFESKNSKVTQGKLRKTSPKPDWGKWQVVIGIIAIFVTIALAVYFQSPSIEQDGDNNGIQQAGAGNVAIQNITESSEIREVGHVLVKLTYKEPVLFNEDACGNGVCSGEYVVIGESADVIRVDPKKCTEFQPTSYRYDTGPYDPETGSYTQLISDWSGTEVRTCGWFDLPKSRVLSRENILYQDSIEKKINNYNTYKSDGSIIVQ